MALGIITAGIPYKDECPVLTRMPVFVTQLGIVPTLQHIFRDSSGQPMDISDYFSDGSEASASGEGSLVLRSKELIADVSPRNPLLEVAGRCLDASSGLVEFDLTAAMVRQAGVYQLSAAIKGPDDNLLHIENPVLWVERSLYGLDSRDRRHNAGPPTLLELRQALMDSAGENRLFDGSEFWDDQIAAAVGRPVQKWNTDPPPLRPDMDTRTFPYREEWLKAICGYLFLAVANNYRRNHLPYNAGGIAIDDMNKEPQYMTIGMKLVEDWAEFVRVKKYQINTGLFVGSIGSAYDGLFH